MTDLEQDVFFEMAASLKKVDDLAGRMNLTANLFVDAAIKGRVPLKNLLRSVEIIFSAQLVQFLKAAGVGEVSESDAKEISDLVGELNGGRPAEVSIIEVDDQDRKVKTISHHDPEN